MSSSEISLRPLSRADAAALRDMAREFTAGGDPRFDALLLDTPAFFADAERSAVGIDLPPDRVRQTQFLLWRGERILGGARLRHELIPQLHRDGGNIGYEIRPSERGRGYGHLILARMLREARAIGLTRVLLTAATSNAASLRVIEAAGGIADGLSVSHVTGQAMRRYWIELG